MIDETSTYQIVFLTSWMDIDLWIMSIRFYKKPKYWSKQEMNSKKSFRSSISLESIDFTFGKACFNVANISIAMCFNRSVSSIRSMGFSFIKQTFLSIPKQRDLAWIQCIQCWNARLFSSSFLIYWVLQICPTWSQKGLLSFNRVFPWLIKLSVHMYRLRSQMTLLQTRNCSRSLYWSMIYSIDPNIFTTDVNKFTQEKNRTKELLRELRRSYFLFQFRPSKPASSRCRSFDWTPAWRCPDFCHEKI